MLSRTLLAAAAALLLAAPAAMADGVVSRSGGEIAVLADGDADRFTVTTDGVNVQFAPAAPTSLDAGAGCTKIAGTVRCPRTGVEAIRIDAGAGDDEVVAGDIGVRVVATLGDGADRAVTGSGFDRISGGPGDDELATRDGRAERIDCGDGADTVTADVIDVTPGCETVDRSDELQPDKDGDGVRPPADCDDRDPRRRPGAFDIAGNGIDEDCDGADTYDPDRDRDGFSPPVDCDDSSRLVHPRADEIPGNAIDEDCDGVRPPFPRFPAYVILNAEIGRLTTITTLVVVDIDGGDTVRVRCAGRGCRFAERVRRAREDADRMVLDRVIRRLRLRHNARLWVDVIRADGVMKSTRYKVRAYRSPAQLIRCITPGDGPIAGC